MRKICNFVIKYSLYALVFFMPLFWLPWTGEVHEFNKQYLLAFLAGMAFLGWLAKMTIVQRKILFKRTPLDIWVLAFTVIIILSGVFSIDKVSSWLGFYGSFSGSIVGIISLCLMYFVVVNNFSLKKTKTGEDLTRKGLSLKKILNLMVVSSWIVVIVAYLSIFNVWSKIPGIPDIMLYRSFNTVAISLEGLAIFLTMVIGVLIGSILTSVRDKKSKKVFLDIALISFSSVLLIIINFWPAWIALGIMTLFLVLMSFWTRVFRWNTNLLTIPIILFLLSVFYLVGINDKVGFLNDNVFFKSNLPQEIILDSDTAKTVAWETFKDYPVLGSGPGTYILNFTKFKPLEFNNSQFWNIRFDKSSNYMLGMIGSSGIVGLVSYLLIILIFLLIISLALNRMKVKSKELKDKLKDDNRLIVLPFFLGWLALAVGQFVYFQNLTLIFFFWLFIALGIVGWQKTQSAPYKKITFSFKKMPEVGLVMNIIFLIIIFAFAGVFYLGGTFYCADVIFNQSAQDNKELILKIEKVVNLNGYRENYRRALSQIYLITAWGEANKNESEQDLDLLKALASGSIDQARKAVMLNPNFVATYENLGAIYRDSRGLVGGTLPFALESFAKASELEPNNPFFYRQRCVINLTNEERDWDETVGLCQKAVDLKENYLDAHIQLALAYEGKGEIEKAIEEMESILSKLKGVSFQRGSDLAGAATEIYFQLGRLYFNINRIEEAIPMFEQAVIITPNYANARYALGLAYQANGRNKDALIQYQIIDQIVPGNENIQGLIKELVDFESEEEE